MTHINTAVSPIGTRKGHFVFRILFFLVALLCLLEITKLSGYCMARTGEWDFFDLMPGYILRASAVHLITLCLVLLMLWDLQKGAFFRRTNFKRLATIAACYGIGFAIDSWVSISSVHLSDFWPTWEKWYGGDWGRASWSEVLMLLLPLHALVPFLFWWVFALLFAKLLQIQEENRLTI